MKDEGWLFASHTWGHQNVSQVSLERLQADTQKFKENVDPLIGGTDIIIFAFGADLTSVEDYSGEKFEYLKGQGYNYYCNVDSSQYFVQIRSNYSAREGEIWMDTECTIIRNFFQICLMHRQCLILPDRCRSRLWDENNKGDEQCSLTE